MARVIRGKGAREMGPVVLLVTRSLALDIPMRVELPLRALLRGGPDLEGTYVVYLHGLFADDGQEYVYYGITKRGWNYRFGEHMKAALSARQARLFSQKLADLIEAQVAQLAGQDDGRPKLAGVITALCSVGVDEDMAKDTEEYLVDKYSLASKHSVGLNMIPGGREGIRLLHQLSGKAPETLVEPRRESWPWLNIAKSVHKLVFLSPASRQLGPILHMQKQSSAAMRIALARTRSVRFDILPRPAII
jgi:hypothetical protein